MPAVTVKNLATQEERVYTCSPDEAVLAAYAQEHGDWNTWDYQDKYSKLLKKGQYTYLCGDWSTIHSLPPRRENV
jgi:uncharacterized protein YutD